jgi:hypothetical protein
MAFCLETPKEESRNCQRGVPKLPRFGLPQLCETITPRSDLWSGWGLKQSCSSCQMFSTLCRTPPARMWVKLILDFSWSRVKLPVWLPTFFFYHNSYCKCPNGSCKPISDIYTSIFFQWYKELPNARCFDLCNRSLKVRESRWTPKLPFQECEFSPSHSLKIRVATWVVLGNELDFFCEPLSIRVIRHMTLMAMNHWPINYDFKPLRFGSIFLCETIGSGHILHSFFCLKCCIITNYNDLHYHVHSNFLLQIYKVKFF